ncbi:MAG: hypothetical protein ACEPOZ_05950 [Marinifilaceae bacterium]
MKQILSFLALFLVLTSGKTFAQNKDDAFQFNFNKLKPIVQVFGTASYDVENDFSDYSIGRAHLGFQYEFSEKWSAKLIVDRGRPTHIGPITVTDIEGNELLVQSNTKEGSYYTMFLKFASLRWKVNRNLSFEGGAILQNHYITQEKFWGLRYVAQTFQDKYWKISSTDLGFIARYKINGSIALDAAVTNGEGSRVHQDKYGKVKYAAGIDFTPSSSIQSRICYHSKQSGQNQAKTEQMFSAFLGLHITPKMKLGGEYNYMSNLNNIDDLNSYGYSVYSNYKIGRKTLLFGRYDRLLNDLPQNQNNHLPVADGHSVIGGVSYAPVKRVNVSVNYQGWIADEASGSDENRIVFSMAFNL